MFRKDVKLSSGQWWDLHPHRVKGTMNTTQQADLMSDHGSPQWDDDGEPTVESVLKCRF